MPEQFLIKALDAGHYRAGQHHSPAGKAYAKDDFTPAEWKQLKADARLHITDAPDTPGDKNSKDKK